MRMIHFDDLEPAIEDGTMGFCLACGAEAFGVEPDAREYECEECGDLKVYGAEEILMNGWYRTDDDEESAEDE